MRNPSEGDIPHGSLPFFEGDNMNSYQQIENIDVLDEAIRFRKEIFLPAAKSGYPTKAILIGMYALDNQFNIYVRIKKGGVSPRLFISLGKIWVQRIEQVREEVEIKNKKRAEADRILEKIEKLPNPTKPLILYAKAFKQFKESNNHQLALDSEAFLIATKKYLSQLI